MNKLFIFIFLLILYSCSIISINEPNYQDWMSDIKVYFTKPGIDQSTGEDSHIQDKIASLIDSAQNSIDICIYELSLPIIYNSIINAYKRGVKVRFVGDIDNINYPGYIEFFKARIPSKLGNDDKIMHNKFMIIDNFYVITGSANYTTSAFFNNNENVLFIRSSNVANYYKKEFDNFFVLGQFGNKKQIFDGFFDNKFKINSSEIEVYFTPYSNYIRVDNIIINYITNAKSSIYFAIFSFTHEGIASNMINMVYDKNIKLLGLFDKGWHQSSEYSVHDMFINARLNIHFDGNENFVKDNPYSGAKIHNKYLIIDYETDYPIVITGSYNFSLSASIEGNDENIVIIKNDKKIAKSYYNEFIKIFLQGKHPTRDLGGNTANFHDVIFTEIMWAGSKKNNNFIDYYDKFVELKNISSKKINISGWYIDGLINKNYRIFLYIFPENTILNPNEHIIVCYKTNNSAFFYPKSLSFDYFYLYHSTKQTNIFLKLYDCYGNLIDIVGSESSSPFAGSQSNSQPWCSMRRIGDDGLSENSWITTSNYNNYVNTNYTQNTKATPGTD